MPDLAFDPKKTALIVVDLQRGIVGMKVEPRGSAEVVRNSAALAAGLRAKGAFIVLVRVTGSPDGKDRLRPDCDAPTAAAGRATGRSASRP